MTKFITNELNELKNVLIPSLHLFKLNEKIKISLFEHISKHVLKQKNVFFFY